MDGAGAERSSGSGVACPTRPDRKLPIRSRESCRGEGVDSAEEVIPDRGEEDGKDHKVLR